MRMLGFSKVSNTGKYVMLFFIILDIGAPVNSKKRKHSNTPTNQTEVIQRLSNFFGIERIPGRIFRRPPPEYMVDLYNSITDSGGLMRRESPYQADVVRSFPDRQWNHSMHFYYNVSHLSEKEKILAAEFHVFKMRPSAVQNKQTKPPYVIEIKIYQVLDPVNIYSINGLKLLDARRISAISHGWYVFQVHKAVEAWVNGTAENHGFLVSTTSVAGRDVNGSYIRFAQRHQHHDSKQPILVVYTDDGLSRHPSYISPDDEDYLQIKEDILKKERSRMRQFKQAVRLLNEKDRDQYVNKHLQKLLGDLPANRSKRSVKENNNNNKLRTKIRKKRKSKKRLSKEERQRRREERRKRRKKLKEKKKGKGKRALDFRYHRKRRNCAKHQMYVDFDEIGWSGWIISPKGYNAYHCKGACPFPLGQSQKPTNHATVQSIVHALKVGKDVSTPCCVPNKLYSISLLYFDDDENVILKQYDDMVAASCGCH